MSRENFINQARTWIDTPFKHQGRLKGVGCDCLGLIIGVCRELNLKNSKGQFYHEMDVTAYSRFPNTDFLIHTLQKEMITVDSPENGDIIIFDIKNYPQHLALFYDDKILHSYQPANKVIEQKLDINWKKRINKIFRMNIWHQ